MQEHKHSLLILEIYLKTSVNMQPIYLRNLNIFYDPTTKLQTTHKSQRMKLTKNY